MMENDESHETYIGKCLAFLLIKSNGSAKREVEEDTTVRNVVWKGVGFGLTSGVITTLGLIIGLHSGTHSKLAVLAGLIVLAIADAMSDAMGIHVSEEAEMEHSTRELWETTSFTFVSKFIVSFSFAIPIVLLEISTAIMASVAYGVALIMIFSFGMAKAQKQNPSRVIVEHILIAILVIILAHYIGDMVYGAFST